MAKSARAPAVKKPTSGVKAKPSKPAVKPKKKPSATVKPAAPKPVKTSATAKSAAPKAAKSSATSPLRIAWKEINNWAMSGDNRA
jgi:hypothetical protein